MLSSEWCFIKAHALLKVNEKYLTVPQNHINKQKNPQANNKAAIIHTDLHPNYLNYDEKKDL